jgi:hypothetical protein
VNKKVIRFPTERAKLSKRQRIIKRARSDPGIKRYAESLLAMAKPNEPPRPRPKLIPKKPGRR